MAASLAVLAAAPGSSAPFDYALTPEPIGDGIWIIRGADAAIAMANGGAIANITMIDTMAGVVFVDAGPSLRYGKDLIALGKRVTGKAVARVYLTHLHPDHTYGDAAFDPAQIAATPALIATLKAQGAGFSDGMYRLLGDWMRGTELRIPGHVVTEAAETIGGRTFRMLPLAGHSDADLAILDERTGTLIAGDLVFHDRAPSTPHATLATWRTSLDTLKRLGQTSVVPGHGPYDRTPAAAIDQTRAWIDWLEKALADALGAGMDMVEAGDMPIPPQFATLKAARYELQRSVSHFYPGLEAAMLPVLGKLP